MSRNLLASVRALLVFTVILGLAYPMAITMLAVARPALSQGDPIYRDGTLVASGLLAQQTNKPQWFHPRPSAVTDPGAASGGSNLGPNDKGLLQQQRDREQEVRALNPQQDGPVPADAVTASGSGLDPHISVAYARYQTARVAQARGISEDQVAKLVREHTDYAFLGFLGQDSVNVTRLNAALAGLDED